MKARTATLLLLCAFLSCTSANIANAERQNREVGTFRKVSTGGGIDVYFTQDKTQSIRVETENVDVDDVVTEVKNETLVLKMKDKYSRGVIKVKKTVIKVYVSAPELDGLSTSGGSDFYADNLKSEQFNIASSGGSEIHIGNLIVNDNINIVTSGGSDCNIKNLKANTCKLSSSGGSNIKIGMEISGNLSVSASGASGIKLGGIANSISLVASGASDIKLGGKVNSISLVASGSSDIDVRNLEYKQIDSKTSGGADIHK